MEVIPFRKIHPSSLMQFGSFDRLVLVSDRSNFDISEGRNPQAGMTGLGTFENFWLMPFGFVWKCGIPQKWPHEWEHMYDKPCRSEVPHCRTNPFWEPRTFCNILCAALMTSNTSASLSSYMHCGTTSWFPFFLVALHVWRIMFLSPGSVLTLESQCCTSVNCVPTMQSEGLLIWLVLYLLATARAKVSAKYTLKDGVEADAEKPLYCLPGTWSVESKASVGPWWIGMLTGPGKASGIKWL